MRPLAWCLLCLAGLAGPVEAVQVDVRNCAGATAELQAYNINDIVKVVPYSTLSLVNRTSGLIACESEFCYLRIQVGTSSTSAPYARDYLCLTSVLSGGTTIIRTDRACLC